MSQQEPQAEPEPPTPGATPGTEGAAEAAPGVTGGDIPTDGEALRALRLSRLATMSAAGARLAQHIVRQSDEADYLPPEGALMYARLTRAVRLTIALERRLGSHDPEASRDQITKLNTLSGIGLTLVDRLEAQVERHSWSSGLSILNYGRVSNGVRRTCALEERIQRELGLTEAEREAAQQERVAASKARRELARARASRRDPDTVPDEALELHADATLAAATEGEAEAALPSPPPERDGQERAYEVLREPSEEDELGDHPLADVAAAVCELTGVEYEPAVFETPDGAVVAGAEAADSAAKAAGETPAAAAPDADGTAGEHGARSAPSQDPTHDPPSG